MKQYNGITERQMQIGACLIIALILGSIHLALPGFYSTLITLAMDGNVPGLQAYILSYGYLSMAISILMILLTNMTGLPSLPLLIVNGLVLVDWRISRLYGRLYCHAYRLSQYG